MYTRSLALVAVLTLASGCAVNGGLGGLFERGEQDTEPADEPTLTAGMSSAEPTDPSVAAAGHYLNALIARNNGDYEYAMHEMSRAVTLDPAEPRLRLGLVNLQIRSGELDAALDQSRLLRLSDPEDPDHSRLIASLLVSLRRYDDAAVEYVALAEKVPGDQEVLVQLGSLYNRMGRHVEAIDVLTRAVDLGPESVIANFFLGRSYALNEQYDEALRHYLRASKLRPSHDQILLELGSVYERLSRTDDAISSYRRALEFNPNQIAARRRLGALYVTTRQLDEAIKEFEGLIELEEDPIETQRKIGLISLEKGDYARASTEFNLVLGANPDDDDVRFYLAATYYQMGDIVAAEREFLRIKATSRRYVDARHNLSQLLLDDGRPMDAIAAIEELLTIDPESRQGLVLLSELYRQQELFGKALQVAQVLVDLEPENEDYLFKLAYLHHDAGHVPRTIRLLRQILELNSDNPLALNFLGYTFAERGENLDEAEALVRKALELRPNDGAFIDSLGWVYYQQGRYESAVGELEKANQLAGEDPVVREHLADAYAKVGRTQDAIRMYRDCEARSEDTEQKQRVQRKIIQLGGRTTSGPGN